MKFNWRANWEILLVFVIIVIGIVVTTIAAIRSKDKHLLALSDDTDYGQLLGSGAIASGGAGASLPQITTAPTSSQVHEPGSSRPHRSPDEFSDALNSRKRSQDQASPGHKVLGARNKPPEAQVVTSKVQRSAKTADEHSDGRHESRRTNQQVNHSVEEKLRQDASLAKDTAKGSDETLHDDSKRGAKTTENSEVPTRINQAIGAPDENNINSNSANDQFYHDDISNTNNEDDIHTTRTSMTNSDRAQPSSLAESSNGPDKIGALSNGTSSATGAIVNSSVPYEQQRAGPSLSLFAPYRATPLAPDYASALRLHQHHLHQHHLQTGNEPPTLESADMLTSYGKALNANNSTDMIPDFEFSDQQPSNSSGGFRNRLASQLFDSALLSSLLNNNNQIQNFDAAHLPVQLGHLKSHSMPFSMILGDLIKLTRGQQTLVNPQATSVEEPVNSARPQMGILRQLRSFPGPLMALLQGNLNGAQSGSDMMPQNYDASESNQHYHRVSMGPPDLESIIARNVRSSGVLPAFSPPKDVPQNWYPQNTGGNPNLQAAMSNNADFVANNIAGYVRLDAQQPTQYRRIDERSQDVISNGPTDNIKQSQAQHQQQQLNSPQQVEQPQQDSDAQMQSTFTQQQQQQQQQSQGNNLIGSQPHQTNTRSDNLPAPQYNSPAVGLQFGPQRNNVNQPNSFAPTTGAVGQNYHPYNSMPLQQQQQQQQQNLNKFAAGKSFDPSMNIRGSGGGIRLQSDMPISSIRQQQTSPNFDISAQVGHMSSSEFALKSSVPPNMNSPTGVKISLNQIASSNSHGPQVSKQVVQPLSRRRRAAGKEVDDYAKYANDIQSENGHDEQFSGSSSVSVVHPDGSPTKGIRINYRPRAHSIQEQENKSEQRRGNALESKKLISDEQVSSTMPQVKHMVAPPMNHYEDASGGNHRGEKKRKLRNGAKQDRNHRSRSGVSAQRGGFGPGTVLEPAGSGLMSKLLLGTASTNDELEEDIDSDDEDGFSGERRKEEGDDTDPGNNGDQPAHDRAGFSSVDDGGNEGFVGLNGAQQANTDDPNIGTGSSEKEGYASRHQHQRSDIDFYGHPGEETRQLKYGILGSGNYEVVNGGIYPEADESTAAVNSVANYVRKPNGLLMADLPRLLSGGGGGGGSGASDGSSQAEHDNSLGAFVPGGRLPSGGFMRVASGNPNELVSLMPPNKLDVEKGFTGPLLQFIDTPGTDHPGLLAAQLGGSGTSARTTFAIKDGKDENEEGGDDLPAKSSCKDGHCSRRRPMSPSSEHADEDEYNKVLVAKNKRRKEQHSSRHHTRDEIVDNGRIATQTSSNHIAPDVDTNSGAPVGSQRVRVGGGSRSNQFNLYQISPSKKVTIFSDQDLDSAPSDETLRIASRAA